MVKSISGVKERVGTVVTIGDNRYGLREAYDPVVDRATKEFYRKGDTLTIIEVKDKTSRVVRTEKP